MSLNAFRNRLQIDTSLRDGVVEVLNGGNPFFWNGGATQFEIGLFRKETLVTDLSNISQITLEVKPAANILGTALMSATITGSEINGALTQAQWEAGAEDDCHGAFIFTGSAANLDLGDDTEKQFWLVIAAKRTDGESFTLGCATLTVQEDGSSITPSSAGSSGFFRFNLGYGEIRYNDSTWHRLKPVMFEGQYTLDVEQTASAQIADFDSSKWRYNGGYPQLQWDDASWHDLQAIMFEGQYTLDVNQAAAGSFDGVANKFRVGVAMPEIRWPDLTWHLLRARIIEGQYTLDIEQTATP